MTDYTTATFTFAYPNPSLSRLDDNGEPNRQTILKAKRELCANAKSIDSVWGIHGHLFLILNEAEYATLNNNVIFNIPEKSTLHPDYEGTASQIEEQ